MQTGGSRRSYAGPRGGREAVVERVVRAAQRLFAERGPGRVTVRDIAAEAGVSHALVHQYLGSKADILRAVVERDRAPRADVEAPGAHELFPTLGDLVAERLEIGSDYDRVIARAFLEGIQIDDAQGVLSGAEDLAKVLAGSRTSELAKTAEPTDDDRAEAAVLVGMVVGWLLLEDRLLASAGLSVSDTGRRLGRSALAQSVERLVTGEKRSR